MFGFDSEAYDSELTPEEYSKIRLDLLVFVDVMLDNNDFELESLEVLYDSFTAMIKETVPKEVKTVGVKIYNIDPTSNLEEQALKEAFKRRYLFLYLYFS
ncbi:MAG: hypothetical protein QM217_08385 [Bacillota bacterium]|jgi:hypothetical protein|nr:hypothetical protein [Bacillota bacterium]